MFLSTQAISILLVLAVVTNILYGLVVYARNRKHPTNQTFFMLTVAASVWGATMYLLRADATASPEVITLLAQVLFIAAAAIPTSFLYLTYTTSHHEMPPLIDMVLPALAFGALAVFIFTPTYFIQNVSFDNSANPIIAVTVVGRVIFGTYLMLLFGAVYVILIKKIRVEESKVRKMQLIYILVGTMIPAVVGVFTNFALPAAGLSSFNWLGPSSVVASTGIILYGIIKHSLFDIRVIATEILMAILWLIAFIRVATSESVLETLFNLFTFILLIIIGIMLVRSIIQEVETREKLEELTAKLQSANARLRDLDRQKSEFLSIATHQLRGPLAGIRGHLSLIVDGSYGKVPERALDILRKVFDSSGMLAQTINDFLDVSRIEQGRMQYDKKEFDCTKLLEEIIGELEPIAQERKLSLSFKSACPNDSCVVNADYGKLRHIFFNLVDNAIKYTEEGWVKVEIQAKKSGGGIRVEVSDSGIGIGKDEIHALFEKFVRARGASGINVNGTGLGLYVAREMVEAHKGKIWAESEGKGKGSTFIVELPAAKKSNRSQK